VNCKPCFHPKRDQIDRQIVAGTPYRTIAASTGLSLGSLSRHKVHVQQTLGDAIRARESERTEHGSKLLNRVTKLVDEAESLLVIAKSKENIVGATSAINAACRLLELCGRLSGGLATRNTPGIHLNFTRNETTTINNYGDDTEIAVLVAEATNQFDPLVIARLRALAEGQSTAATGGQLADS